MKDKTTHALPTRKDMPRVDCTNNMYIERRMLRDKEIKAALKAQERIAGMRRIPHPTLPKSWIYVSI